jgi:WD40 repeat protein
LAHNGSVNDAVFSPSEGRIATAGGDGLVKVQAEWRRTFSQDASV